MNESTTYQHIVQTMRLKDSCLNPWFNKRVKGSIQLYERGSPFTIELENDNKDEVMQMVVFHEDFAGGRRHTRGECDRDRMDLMIRMIDLLEPCEMSVRTLMRKVNSYSYSRVFEGLSRAGIRPQQVWDAFAVYLEGEWKEGG